MPQTGKYTSIVLLIHLPDPGCCKLLLHFFYVAICLTLSFGCTIFLIVLVSHCIVTDFFNWMECVSGNVIIFYRPDVKNDKISCGNFTLKITLDEHFLTYHFKWFIVDMTNALEVCTDKRIEYIFHNLSWFFEVLKFVSVHNITSVIKHTSICRSSHEWIDAITENSL